MFASMTAMWLTRSTRIPVADLLVPDCGAIGDVDRLADGFQDIAGRARLDAVGW